MYDESDFVMLSALQHYGFCPRQCALIHLNQEWAENVLTTQGQQLHECADRPGLESRGDSRIVRAVPLASRALGLAGRADVVEFIRDDCGVTVRDWPGRWRSVPIEYKRGRPKRDHCDDLQLCAQAMCLEEMFGCSIPAAALFYGQTRRRHQVELGAELRALVRETAEAIHAMLSSGQMPTAKREPKCKNCSLLSICLPVARKQAAPAWLTQQLQSHLADHETNP